MEKTNATSPTQPVVVKFMTLFLTSVLNLIWELPRLLTNKTIGMDFQNLPCDIKKHIFNVNRVENNKQLLANRKKYDEVVKQWKNVMWLSYESNCITPHPEDPTFQEWSDERDMGCFWDDQASGHNITPHNTFIHKNEYGCEGLTLLNEEADWFNLDKLP